jgi:hypothetical protein
MNAIAGRPSPRRPARPSLAEQLEQIDWQTKHSIIAYGVRVGVRVDDARITEKLTQHLPPGSEFGEFSDIGRVYSLTAEEDDSTGGLRCSVYVDATPLARRVTLPALLDAFEANLQLHVAEMAPERVFVHAGVVGHRGRAILLPGRSFTGKSTLVAELVRAGAEYYSDEYAVLDAAAAVHPYARPLAMRKPGTREVTKCAVEAIGGRSGTSPLPVGLVIVCAFKPDAQWYPRRLSPGQGVQALLANTVPARRIPETVLIRLRQIVLTAPVFASERGEATGVVGSILDLPYLG